jgi:hypothetical protein
MAAIVLWDPTRISSLDEATKARKLAKHLTRGERWEHINAALAMIDPGRDVV